jgi:hypothetical protein
LQHEEALRLLAESQRARLVDQTSLAQAQSELDGLRRRLQLAEEALTLRERAMHDMEAQLSQPLSAAAESATLTKTGVIETTARRIMFRGV